MPELPEVTTTVNGLKKVLPGLSFTDVWTDLNKKNQNVKQFKETIKDDDFFRKFKKLVMKQKIISIERRAKNILINITGGHTILIHLKMTGHLLYGEYKKIKVGQRYAWVPKDTTSPLGDSYNRFIHFIFHLSNDKYLAFCDSRKFGKVTIFETESANKTIHLDNVGPEPLDDSMTFNIFYSRLKIKPRGNIKTILMDQSIIAGIGNIYSDEMLWSSMIHPESRILKIPKEKVVLLFKEMQKVLKKGVSLGGDSMSDYRNIDGLRGEFQLHHNAYRLTKSICKKKDCGGVIIRKVVNGRSAHFCDKHQQLYL